MGVAANAAGVIIDPLLFPSDRIVLEHLSRDIVETRQAKGGDKTATAAATNGSAKAAAAAAAPYKTASGETLPPAKQTIDALRAQADAADPTFEPTVFMMYDLPDVRAFLQARAPGLEPYLDRYIAWARGIVRVETDVVMVTHLIVYFCTCLPSALILLFVRFTWLHAVAHLVMQGWCMGPYTLLKHQHIHGRGVLVKDRALVAAVDAVFPYIMDPLMGHTWNSYYHHHVKHHHVEGNGPDDLSSTVRYQRDSLRDFAKYVGRFLLLVWWDLPKYFITRGKWGLALRTGFWEISCYCMIAFLAKHGDTRGAVFTLVLPLALMRLALMGGNWGQHAFVDQDEPDSDFRSSITVIDYTSNRLCFNDGYHTSHHLNPLRHWRDHPAAFLHARDEYARQHALVFHDIDYMFITISLLTKNYARLARCMVPIGPDQIVMTLDERAAFLRRHTRAFSEDEIKVKFRAGKKA